MCEKYKLCTSNTSDRNYKCLFAPSIFFAAQLAVAPYQFLEIRVQIPSMPEFCSGFLSAIFLIVPHLGKKFCLTCMAPEGQKVIYFIK